jgi:SAM-dependent methyltransferase
MTVDFAEILSSLQSLKSDGVRVGFPDTSAPISLSDRSGFVCAVDAMVCAFRELRGGLTIVDAKDNSYRKAVVMRVKQLARGDSSRKGVVEPKISEKLAELQSVLDCDDGELHYWGGNNYFDIEVPLADLSFMREFSPDTDGLSWDERYELKLAKESSESLRDEAFRNCDNATMIAEHFDPSNATVFVPSVGICAHPWLFADRGFQVIACDISSTAMNALSQPHNFPLIYSLRSYDRWDISEACSWGYDPAGFHPEYFAGMPDLGSPEEFASLSRRIRFACGDWTSVPVPDDSVDLIFAANALPRTSDDEVKLVTDEWTRALRPDGCIFIAQHHPGHTIDLASRFQDQGLLPCDVRNGDLPPSGRGGYQLYYSSG